jgi:hypothetical protein
MTEIHGWLCSTPIYRYHGVEFECGMSGFGFLKSDGSIYERVPKRFWDVYEKWRKLPKSKQERCRVGGGCRRF